MNTSASFMLGIMRNDPALIQSCLDAGQDPSLERSNALRAAVLRDRTQIIDLLLPHCPVQDIDLIARETFLACSHKTAIKLFPSCTTDTQVALIVRANNIDSQSFVDECLLHLSVSSIPEQEVMVGSYLHQKLNAADQKDILTSEVSSIPTPSAPSSKM